MYKAYNLQFQTTRHPVKRKTNRYVDELWLKFLREADVLDGYKMTRAGDETQIELTFAVDE